MLHLSPHGLNPEFNQTLILIGAEGEDIVQSTHADGTIRAARARHNRAAGFVYSAACSPKIFEK
jgi:hypothetical protein